MTRSLFDPDGGQAEQSGSRNLGGDAEALPNAAGKLVEPAASEAAASQDHDKINPAFIDAAFVVEKPGHPRGR